MRRRFVLTLLAALPCLPRPGWAHASAVSEVRAGVRPDRARRMERRLGIAVRPVGNGLVAALNAGHLEVALLDGAELAAARRLMGERLLVLPGQIEGRIPVTRRVLPPALRDGLAAALA